MERKEGTGCKRTQVKIHCYNFRDKKENDQKKQLKMLKVAASQSRTGDGKKLGRELLFSLKLLQGFPPKNYVQALLH